MSLSFSGNDPCSFFVSKPETERTSLGKFCGRNIEVPGPFSTSKQMAIVHFVSDTSMAHNGFRLEWVVDGCGGLQTKPTGRLASPNYPNVYPMMVECIWYITRPLGESQPESDIKQHFPWSPFVFGLGTSIELNVIEYDLEGQSADCSYDSLTVYGGPDMTSPQLTQLCHRRSTNVTVTSTGNNMVVRFVSDENVRGKGFAAEYRTLSTGKCRTLVLHRHHPRFLVPRRLYIMVSSSPGCGGRMTAPSGIITSPNYPNMYDNNDDCAWLIETDTNHVVRFTFVDFDVEPHNNCRFSLN